MSSTPAPTPIKPLKFPSNKPFVDKVLYFLSNWFIIHSAECLVAEVPPLQVILWKIQNSMSYRSCLQGAYIQLEEDR